MATITFDTLKFATLKEAAVPSALAVAPGGFT